MSKILTAEKFIEKKHSSIPYLLEDFVDLMVEFAKLHCIEQARVISVKAYLTDFACEFLQEGSSEAIDKDSILNAYDLNLIK